MRLQAATKKPIVLKPVRPNVGLEMVYQKRMVGMIDEMNKSILYWLSAAWRANPTALGADASPVDTLRKIMRAMGRRWIKRFDAAAETIATEFATKNREHAERTMKKILKDVGFAVPFKPTPAMRDALQSCIGENVALIKSIPAKQFDQIEQAVMRSVQAGRDLGKLREELEHIGAKTRGRAANIARDQNAKATEAMNKARRISLGLTKSKWLHSHAGMHPRKSHVEANGRIYDTEQGCLIDGEYIMPGEKINCRCKARAIIPGIDDAS